MKNWPIFGILCLTIFYPSLISAVFQDNVIENTKSAVVAIYYDENLNYFRASGFFIDSSGTVLTAKHVTSNYPKLWALMYDGRKLELIPARFEESNDLAIMLPKISEKNVSAFSYLKFSDINSLSIGQHVMTIGNSADGLWQVLYGNIENLHRGIIIKNGNLTFTAIEFNIIVPRGFSGSPLIDESGNVLGINIAKGHDLSYAISLVEIKSFIKEFYKKSPP